ncbi:MAG TPA: hypothetical protein VMF35_08675 [Acidimicrobiales bacterium]|nr:hypothetical protein [Acidimicrobiales bacterium]
MPLADPHYVVVDGSNLATEGRTSPSLKQLEEAVQAYAKEDPSATIIVVVDATFEHRVSDAEREAVREAMLHGEMISPPAGAIGRGDAFVLRIAERTGATVLSNDSFQEFHGEHPWLFDEGRLVGGKPIPGVGWIFTPRMPIRGPKSRAATAEADAKSAPAKAAELAKAAKKAAKRGTKAKKSAKAVDTSWPITPATPPPGRAKLDPVASSAIDEAVAEAMDPPVAQKPKGASKKGAGAKKTAPQKSAKGKKDAGTTAPAPAASRRGDGSSAKTPAAEAGAGSGAERQGRSKKKRATPPPAVNEPLTFINFVAEYPIGSTIEGEVVSFTSHGAMVDVAISGGGRLHCYIPLTAMGTPPPTKARQVLKKGEVRAFVLAGLDPSRRVAELAMPTTGAPGARRGRQAPVPAPAKKAAVKQASAPAAKKAVAKKGAGRKAGATKKPTKKAAAPAKKAAAKARRSPAKKTPAKKAAAKRAVAKKPGSAKKAATKKTAKARRR